MLKLATFVGGVGGGAGCLGGGVGGGVGGWGGVFWGGGGGGVLGGCPATEAVALFGGNLAASLGL